MGTLGTRRWRRANKKGVSPIIATILLVAITVVLAAVLYVLISGLTRGPGNTPLGSAMAVGSGKAGTSYVTAGGCVTATCYPQTISIQSASSGVTANSLKLQLLTQGGTIGSFNIVGLVDVSGCWVGTYATATGWTQSAAVTAPAGSPTATVGCDGTPALTSQISSGDQLVLVTSSSLAGMGDSLNVVGTGSYSGSISAAIP